MNKIFLAIQLLFSLSAYIQKKTGNISNCRTGHETFLTERKKPIHAFLRRQSSLWDVLQVENKLNGG